MGSEALRLAGLSVGFSIGALSMQQRFFITQFIKRAHNIDNDFIY